MIQITDSISQAEGLRDEDRQTVKKLVEVWSRKRERNLLREDYYLSHVKIKDLGISIPQNLLNKIDPRVNWPKKAVHALADRSIFDGFVSDNKEITDELKAISTANSLNSLYRKNLLGELKHCCSFWTVTGEDKPIISAYPATAASALWDDEKQSIKAGMVVVATKKENGIKTPVKIDIFLSDSVIELRKDGRWAAEYKEHSMGRILMEPMAYAPTLERPFGTSRISRTVMSLTDDAIRQRARMEIASESATLPQMWLLGTAQRTISPDKKYDASMGAINEVTKDGDGDVPTVWQSSQLQMAPLSEYWRNLACQMSAETNVPVSFFGVSNDNPASSDSIEASLEPLIVDAKNLNRDNGDALRNIAYMALAVIHETDFETERDSGNNINPRFLSPAYPSIVSLSDAALKQVQAIPKLADSDVILEILDYTEEQMQRINSDNKRAQARTFLASSLQEGSNAVSQE